MLLLLTTKFLGMNPCVVTRLPYRNHCVEPSNEPEEKLLHSTFTVEQILNQRLVIYSYHRLVAGTFDNVVALSMLKGHKSGWGTQKGCPPFKISPCKCVK
jgi:hypothetical protein